MGSKWDLRIEKKCLVCGDSTDNLLVPVCNSCRSRDAANLHRAKMFLASNPDADLDTIASNTKLPAYVLKWHFNKGNLESFDFLPKKDTLSNPVKDILVNEELYGDYIWIKISGKLDSPNSFELQSYIDSLISDGWQNFILDMGNVKFFCSTAVRVVLTAYKKLYGKGSLRIANPSKNVESTLGTIALDKLLLI